MSIDIIALPADILLHALSFLDHKELSLVARVSHRLHVCVDDPSIWHQLCMGISNIDNNSDTNHTTSTSTTTTTSTISRLYSTDLIVKDRDWKTLYQLMGQVPLSNFASYNLLLHGIEASSTDHPSQSIRETLTNSQQFWSSTGSNTPDANEHLIYQLVHPICIITEMQVWIYQCTYQQGLPIYGPRAIRFSLGYTRDSWHYTSPIYPCNNTPDMQSFRLTPHLRCGGYLKIELLGKVSTQSNDNLWYTVLRQVRCHGIPLVMLPRNVLTRAIVAHATTLTPSWTEEMKSSSTSTSHEDAKAVTTPIQRILSNAGAAVASFISSTSTSTSNDDDDDDEKKHEDMDQVDAVMSHLYATASPLIDTQQHINDVLIQCLSRIDAHDIREAANLVIQHLLPRKHEDVRNRVLTYVKEKATDPMDVVIYLIHLLSRRVILNGMETSTLISIQTSTSGNIPRLQGVFSHAYQLHQVTCTKSIGDQLIAAGKWNAAVAVYVVAHVPDMVLKCLIHQGRVATLVAYIQSLHHFAPWDDVLRDILKLHGLTKALELAILLNEWSGGPLLDPDMIMSILSIRPPANEWNHRTILRAALEQARSNETTSSTSTSSRDDPRLDDLDTILFNGGMQMFMAMADEEGGEEEEDGQEDENEDGDRDGD